MTEDSQIAILLDAMSDEFSTTILTAESKERAMNNLQFISTVLTCRPHVIEMVASGTALRIKK